MHGITLSASARRWEILGYMLGQNRIIAKDVKSCSHCCYVINSIIRGNALSPRRRTSIPCTVITSRQKSCNQTVCCLDWLGSRAFVPAKRSGPTWLRYGSYPLPPCVCLIKVYLSLSDSFLICLVRFFSSYIILSFPQFAFVKPFIANYIETK